MKLKQTIFLSIINVLLIGWMASCTDVDITMPKGPKGDPGLSAYEFWKEKVSDGTIAWPKDQVEVTDYFKFLKGEDGKDGKSAYDIWKEEIAGGDVDDPHNPGNKWDKNKNALSDFWRYLTGASGENGQTPRIGGNGNWWIGDVDTKVPAKGKDGINGKDAVPPVITIGANGHWFIDGVDSGKPSKGVDGKTPTVTIGTNGHWFIDGIDTGKPAVGQDGKSPEIAIGTNGHWFINGKDSGKSAYGKDGSEGKSAYQLWKEEIAKGKTPDPHRPGLMWDTAKNTVADFWEFLRGRDGQDGQDGKDGEPGESIIIGMPNVLPTYYNGRMREFVDPKDGSVVFQVYTETGEKAPAGSIVKGLPGMDPNETFTTDDDGKFVISADKLPDLKDISLRRGVTASVTINGVTKPSAPNTTVLNRINTRVNMKFAYLRQAYFSSWTRGGVMSHFTVIYYDYERQVDGVWQLYPEGLPNVSLKSVRVVDAAKPIDATNIVNNDEAASWGRNKLTYGYQSTYKDAITGRILIFRPIVFTPEEESGTPSATSSDWIERQYRENKKYQWNKKDNYFSIQGFDNFYGQTPIMPTAVHIPEIYPLAGIKSPKIDVRTGITDLWGTINLDDLDKFYIKYIEPANPADKWVAQVATKEQLHEKIYFSVGMTKSTSSGTGSTAVNVQVKKFSTGANFVLDSALPNNYLGFYVYLEDKKGELTLGAPNEKLGDDPYFCPYRDGGFFYLKKEGDNYYFENYYDKSVSKRMEVPQSPVPEGWMKK